MSIHDFCFLTIQKRIVDILWKPDVDADVRLQCIQIITQVTTVQGLDGSNEFIELDYEQIALIMKVATRNRIINFLIQVEILEVDYAITKNPEEEPAWVRFYNKKTNDINCVIAGLNYMHYHQLPLN